MTIDCNEVLIFPVLLYIIFSFYLEIVVGNTMFHSFVSELCFRGYIRCSAIRPCREYAVEKLNTHCLLLSGLRAHLVEQQRSVSFLNLNTLFFLTLLILFFFCCCFFCLVWGSFIQFLLWQTGLRRLSLVYLDLVFP